MGDPPPQIRFKTTAAILHGGMTTLEEQELEGFVYLLWEEKRSAV